MKGLKSLLIILLALVAAWLLAFWAGANTGSVEHHGPLAPYTDTRTGPSPAALR